VSSSIAPRGSPNAPSGARRVRAHRRLVFAGWLLLVGGVLVALTSDVLAPFLSPFGLAAGGLTMLAGGQLIRLRTPAASIAAAAFALLVALGAGIAFVNRHPAGAAAGWLAVGLLAVAVPSLAILWADADHLPAAGSQGSSGDEARLD
jgi:hypothetical protein